MKILLDTNFLVYAAKQKIDYSEISGEFFTLSSVVEELEKLSEKSRKREDREAAELALQILKKKKIKVIKTKKYADEAIVGKVRGFDALATMDRGLKKRLKGKTRILTIRGKKKIEFL